MPRWAGAGGGGVAGSLGAATGVVVVVVVVEVVSVVASAAWALTVVSPTPAASSPIANFAVFIAAHRESDCFG
jgi:hypothetical protein